MIQLVLIYLHYRCLCAGITLFLSLALAILTLDAHAVDKQQPCKRDQSLGVSIDKEISKDDQVPGQPAITPAITTPPPDISMMEVEQLSQMDHQRDDRIAIVENGYRYERGRNHVDKLELAEDCSQLMEEFPNYTGPPPSSFDIEKIELSSTSLDLILRPKLFRPTSSSVLGLDLISSRIELLQPCTDLILHPKSVSTSPPVIQDLSSTCWVAQLNRMVSPVTAPVTPDTNSVFPIPPIRLPKLLPPATTSAVDALVKATTLISPPVDLLIITLDDIQAKVALQVKICRERKACAAHAAKALRNAWKRDSTHRRRVKARKQAEKAMLISNDKLDEIRREEKKIRILIQKMEERKL